MAISIDNSSTANAFGAVNVASISYTVGAGTSLLVVFVLESGTTNQQVSSVTWQGARTFNPLSLGAWPNGTNAYASAEAWYIVNPASGSGTIQVNLTNTPSDGWGVAIFSLKGTYGDPYNVHVALSSSTNPLSPSTATKVAASGDWFFTFASLYQGGVPQDGQTASTVYVGGNYVGKVGYLSSPTAGTTYTGRWSCTADGINYSAVTTFGVAAARSLASANFTTPGAGSWVCPAGVTSVQVECWGTGGDGALFSTGVGGGAGSYARLAAYSVTPGSTYSFVVGSRTGSGGVISVVYTDTTFMTTACITRHGVTGGAGGASGPADGDAAITGNTGDGGPGGQGAPAAVTYAPGGAGGNSSGTVLPSDGTPPGCGGGGSWANTFSGKGGGGQVTISWPPLPVSGSGAVTAKKPVVAIAAAETFSATGAATAKKPTVAIDAQTFVLTPISGVGAVVAKKPVVEITASWPVPITVVGAAIAKKPTVSASAVERFIGSAAILEKKPRTGGTAITVPPLAIWPRLKRG